MRDKVRLAPEWNGTTLSFGGQITPGSAGDVFTKFGVELTKPHALLCDIAAAELMTMNDRIHYGDRRFAVRSAPMIWDAVAPTFAEVALEELDHA